jgi:cytochrome c oxidase subunit I
MASIAAPQVYAPTKEHKTTGWWSWITTIDHKRIGLLYGVSAFFFFLVGGLEALVIRTQLARPDNHIVSAARYNELFTMHGTTMIFLAVMPLSNAFFNYIVPLQIGARDVAFPRLNSFAFWTFLAGAIILNMSWFFDLAPNQGWYGYAPLTELAWNPGRNVDFWILGLQILGVSSVAAGINFVTTILNLRAPGMNMMRLPIFTWATLITQILIVMAFPAVTIALVLLSLDRYAGTGFYEQAAGGDPLLWQHLFWVFGHPEVYILILPAFGIVSEIIPVFSRKPLFGYAVMVYALAAIAFLGFGVWAHHMFTTGLGPTANAIFAGSTMLIAIPTGVKIFNWIGTMFHGSLKFTTAMLFAVGLVSQFTIGGISGVMHASPLVDSHHNDTYFVIAHFHYVLFGGSIFGLIAATYYWFPKMSGRMMDEKLGRMNFWLTFIGFNATFFPMHFLGLAGMPRRYYTYGANSGWNFWNLVVSIGAFVLAASILLFIYNIAHSLKKGEIAGNNPWDAPTLEWAIPSPPPAFNFVAIPNITHRDPLWAEKYGVEHGDESQINVNLAGGKVGELDATPGGDIDTAEMHAPHATTATLMETREDAEGKSIHMPNPSFYPFIVSVGLFVAALGLLIDNPKIKIQLLNMPTLCAIGLLLVFAGIYGWAFEPASD